MKLENVVKGEVYLLKTKDKALKSLKKDFSERQIENIVNNTYNDDYFHINENEVTKVKVVAIDSCDEAYNVSIELYEDEEVSAWTNAYCLKKIK